MKEKFTAVYIVKNEEEMIERSINSVRKYVSQIVVIDTGSDDSTAVLATSLGAEVYFYKWDDNFSNARNFALAHVRKDWVIALDADEVLDSNIIFDSEIINNEKVGGITCNIINYINKDDDSQVTEHSYTRIFRNNKAIRYAGNIHEQIRPSIEELGLEIVNADINIYHYGYIDTGDAKKIRNKSMLENNLSGDDHFNIFHLAETEFALQNNPKAKELFNTVRNSPQLDSDTHEKIRLKLGQIALAEEDFITLNKELDFTSDNINYEGFRKFIIGASLLIQKDYKKAKQYYQSAEILQSNMVDKNVIEKANIVLSSL